MEYSIIKYSFFKEKYSFNVTIMGKGMNRVINEISKSCLGSKIFFLSVLYGGIFEILSRLDLLRGKLYNYAYIL